MSNCKKLLVNTLLLNIEFSKSTSHLPFLIYIKVFTNLAPIKKWWANDTAPLFTENNWSETLSNAQLDLNEIKLQFDLNLPAMNTNKYNFLCFSAYK